MTSKLSIDNRCFAGMRAAFDNALEGVQIVQEYEQTSMI